MRQWLFWTIASLVMITGCSDCGSEGPIVDPNTMASPMGDYLGEKAPDLYPELFGARVINGYLFDRDITFSPDLDEFFYTLTNSTGSYHVILWMQRFGKKWGEPSTAPFSGNYSDMEAMFSPDGRHVYFSSNRPLLDSITEPGDFNIWRSDRLNDGSWSPATPLDTNVNSSSDEFYPCMTESGNLYFTSSRENSKGGEDIYMCRPNDIGGYHPAESISEGVNTEHHEFNAYVAADETYIIFSSSGRADDLGRGDLYGSFMTDSGWSASQNYGPFINSDRLDFSPYISPDGEYLFFSSLRTGMQWHDPYRQRSRVDVIDMFQNIYNGMGNIFWVKVSNLPDLTVVDSTSNMIDTTAF